MSLNNIYLTVDAVPYKKYVKTIPSMLSGKRLGDEGKGEVVFILKSNPDQFDYDSEVLEIYSEREDRFLRQSNPVFFKTGMLKEYVGDKADIDTHNLLSDAEIMEIAGTRNLPSLVKRLAELDSVFTLQRILSAAREIGRPAKTLEVIENRLRDLEEK